MGKEIAVGGWKAEGTLQKQPRAITLSPLQKWHLPSVISLREKAEFMINFYILGEKTPVYRKCFILLLGNLVIKFHPLCATELAVRPHERQARGECSNHSAKRKRTPGF